MGRNARQKRPPIKPVEKIQLNEENTTLRAVLAVVFLAVGVSAIVFAVGRLFTVDPGWDVVEASAVDGPNCSQEFVFYYEFGASGVSVRDERRALNELYSRACRKAYQLFHVDESFEGMVNLRDINQRPNEVLEVDPALYRALEAIQAAGDRTVYLGPVVIRYDDLFYCQDDVQLKDFDPRINPEVESEYAAYAAFAADPEQIDLELLGNNQVRLRVSEDYLAYAKREEIERFLDFGWMKNAFIADYLAETMMEEGCTCGTISSLDGFARCLDSRAGGFGVNLLAWREKRPIQAGMLEYQGPMSIVSLRAFPAADGDEYRYYQLRNGEIRTLYLDPEDGFSREAVDSMVCWSPAHSCAELAMKLAPAYIADTLREEPLRELVREGARLIWCEDETFYTSDPEAVVSVLYEGFTLKTVNMTVK